MHAGRRGNVYRRKHQNVEDAHAVLLSCALAAADDDELASYESWSARSMGMIGFPASRMEPPHRLCGGGMKEKKVIHEQI